MDYCKAFDCVSRRVLLNKLKEMEGQDTHDLSLIHNILIYNYIRKNDTVQKSKEITQTRGVPQGGPTKPILFNIMTMNITQICMPSTLMYIYADNMAIGSTNRR